MKLTFPLAAEANANMYATVDQRAGRAQQLLPSDEELAEIEKRRQEEEAENKRKEVKKKPGTTDKEDEGDDESADDDKDVGDEDDDAEDEEGDEDDEEETEEEEEAEASSQPRKVARGQTPHFVHMDTAGFLPKDQKPRRVNRGE